MRSKDNKESNTFKYEIMGSIPTVAWGTVEDCYKFSFYANQNLWKFTIDLLDRKKTINGKYGKGKYPCTNLRHKEASRIINKCIKRFGF